MELSTLFYGLAIVVMVFWLLILLTLAIILVMVYKKFQTAKSDLNLKLHTAAGNTLAKTLIATLMIPLAKSAISHFLHRSRKS